MDKNEDIRTPTAKPGTAGEPANPAATPPAGQAQAGEPTVESKIELASIESPTIAPTMTDMVAGLDAPKIERPVAEKFEELKPESPHDAAPASRDIILAALAPSRVSRKFSKFTLLAASVVLAAAFGAMAGVLGATGVARLAGETATAEEPSTLQTTITQLRSEIADPHHCWISSLRKKCLVRWMLDKSESSRRERLQKSAWL